MTTPFTNVANTQTISTTEKSLPSFASAAPTAQTTAAYITALLDCSAMAAGDQFNVVVYEKINGGTQRVVATFPIVGAQGEIVVLGPFALGEGWDITIKKIAGTDRSIGWSLRENVSDVNVVTWRGTQPSNVVGTGAIEAAVVMYGNNSSGASIVADDTEMERWPHVVKVSESTSARRRIYFYVLSVAFTGGGAPAGGGGGTIAPPAHLGDSVFQRNTLARQGASTVALMMGAEISKNGAASTTAAGTFGEGFDHGMFWYEFTAGEIDTLGFVELRIAKAATSGTVKPRTIVVQVVAADQFDAVRLGLTALPNANANAAGGLPARITTAGTATAGASTTITLAASAVATTNYYSGQIISIVSGTGVGQSKRILGYTSGRVATVNSAWATNPDATSVYIVEPDSGWLEDSSITSAKIASGAITSTGIAASAIGASQIASAAITAAKFATDAIDSNALATTAVTEIQTGLATSTAVALIQADTDDIQTRIPAALDGSGFMKSQVKGIDTTALDLIWNYAVEGSKTVVHYMRIIKSAVAGKLIISGGGRSFRDDADTKDRITATTDATGRPTIAVDGT